MARNLGFGSRPYDPPGVTNPPEIPNDRVSADATRLTYTAAQLATLVGTFDGCVVMVSDLSSAPARWVAGDQSAANGTTILGTTLQGRWQVQSGTGTSNVSIPGLVSSALSSRLGLQDGEQVITVSRTGSYLSGGATWRFRQGVSASPLTDARVNASNGQYELIHNGEWDARWSGVVADGVELTDVVVNGTTTLTSASGGFATARVGQRILIETPSLPCTGTVTITNNDRFISGSGTSFIAEVLNTNLYPNYNLEGSGVGLCIAGQRVSAQNIASDTGIRLTTFATASASGQLAYRELQLEATITAVVSSTQVQISATPVYSETGVRAVFGTDNAAAISAAVTLTKALGLRITRFPAGVICIFSNTEWTGISDLVLTGAGKQATKLRDLRRASREYIYTTTNKGILTFQSPTRVSIQDMSINGSVPVRGFSHSGGGQEFNNGTGGRNGVVINNGVNCEILRIHADGYGARDEFIYVEGDSPGTKIRDCDGVCNNVGININTSNTCERVVISGCEITACYSPFLNGSGNAVAQSCVWSMPTDFYGGADLFVVEASAKMQCSGHTVSGHRSPDAGVSAVSVFSGGTDPGNVQLSGFVLDDNAGLYANGLVALAREGYLTGIAKLSNFSCTNTTSDVAGSCYAFVKTPSAKAVTIDQFTGDAAEDSGMAFGIIIDESVPDDVVTTTNLAFTRSIRNPANYVISGAEASFMRMGGWLGVFEADHWEGSGGNVATFHDRFDISRYLTVTGTIATPTADAALANKLSAHFTGTQYADSNQTPNYWAPLHGPNSLIINVFVPTEVTDGTIYLVCSTMANVLDARGINFGWVGNDNWYAIVGNGTQNVTTTIPAPSPVPVSGTALIAAMYRASATTIIRQGASMTALGSAAADGPGSASSSDPSYSLRIGASTVAGEHAKMRWGGTYLRGPGSVDFATIAAYLAWRWT